MHIKVDAATLASELALAMGAVEKRTTIPILANVLLRANGEGMAICSTNPEIAFGGFVEADVRTDGAVALPARKLHEYVRQLQGELEIKVSDKFWASMACGKSKQRLAGMAPDAWPEVHEPTRELATVAASKLTGAFGRTIHAVMEAPFKNVPPGALLAISEGLMTVTATDSSRAARFVCPAQSHENFSVLVPLRAMAEVGRMPSEGGSSIDIAEDDSHLFFTIGKRRLVALRLAGNFPDVGRAFPKSYPHFVDFDAAELSSAIGRVYGLADERTRRIALTLGPQCSVTSSNSGLGQCDEEIDGSCGSPSVTFGISAPYLTDALKACRADRVRIQFMADKNKPLHIEPAEPVEGESYFSIVMPMY